MREAVIVSTARTPIGKAYRGAFNNTHGATLAAHSIKHAVERAKIEPGEVEDIILGCAVQQGPTGNNVARQAAIRAGMPVTVGGTTIDRQCSSGMQAIAIAAQRVILDQVPIMVAGAVESISLAQVDKAYRLGDGWILRHKPDLYMPMLQPAETVAKRYNISREQQDDYGFQSFQRYAAA